MTPSVFTITLLLLAAGPTSGPASRPAAAGGDEGGAVAESMPASAPASGPASGPADASRASDPATGEGPVLDLSSDEPEVGEGLVLEEDGAAAGRRGGLDEYRIFSSLGERVGALASRTVIGGYGSVEFVAEEGRDSFFDMSRYVLFVYSRLTPRISIATEIEWEHGGSPHKSNGELGVGEVLLEFSIIDFEITEWLVARAGILLVPFGRLNINHDAPTLDLTARPLPYTTVVPSTWFETGAGFHGVIKMGRKMRLDYEIYVVNGLDSSIQDGLGYRAARGSLSEDNNQDKAIVGRIGFSPFLGLDVGLSGYTGAYNRRGARANLVGIDLTWKLGPFELLAEAVRAFNDPGFDDDYETSSRLPVPEDMHGYFIEARLHFMPKFLTRALPEDLKNATFTGVIRYEGVDPHMGIGCGLFTCDEPVRNEHDKKRLTLGLNFRPIEAVALKLDFALTKNHADGARSHIFNRPSPMFMASAAYLF